MIKSAHGNGLTLNNNMTNTYVLVARNVLEMNLRAEGGY